MDVSHNSAVKSQFEIDTFHPDTFVRLLNLLFGPATSAGGDAAVVGVDK